MKIIFNLGIKTVLYLNIVLMVLTVLSECKTEKGMASLNTDSQWSKQEACSALATRVRLEINHNTSITSGE